MTTKKFNVSITAWGKVAVGMFLREIEADSEVSAINKGVSMACVSGMLSPRVCAILKETARRAAYGTGHMRLHGIEVSEWAVESRDGDKGKGKNKGK